MEKTSKVTRVTGNGTWESKFGLLYKFEVELENGDIGEYNSKSKDQTKFVVGQQASYDITSREYNGKTFFTIKPAEQPAPPPAAGGRYDAETSKKIARMSVLKCATDLAIHEKIRLDTIFEWAKMMESYVESGHNPIPTQDVPSDGLPF